MGALVGIGRMLAVGVVVTVGLTAAVGAVDGTGGRAGDPSGTDGGTTFLLSGLSRASSSSLPS